MKRRDFIKNSSLGTSGILAGSSMLTFLVSCNQHDMNGMNMVGQPVPVTEGSFSRLLPVPNTVNANTTLTAQATTANINGSNISVLGYQAIGMLGPTILV